MKHDDLINNYSNLDLEVLPTKLKKNGFEYELVKRVHSKCIYRQIGAFDNFEVFKTKIIEYRKSMEGLCKTGNREYIAEDYCEYKETFPGDEEFGKRAWTYPTLELALKRYETLN